MHAKQLALDLHVRGIQADINQLAGTLPEILQRLEDKLDICAERGSAGGARALPQPWRTGSFGVHDRFHRMPPRNSSSGGLDMESGSEEQAPSCTRQETEQGAVHLPESARQNPHKCTSSGAVPDKKGAAEPALDTLPRLMGVEQDTANNALDRAVSSTTDPLRDSMGRLMDGGIGAKLESLDKMLVQIINVLVKSTSEGDDDEDRKRLKEKLKQAIEADRRSRIRPIVSRSEMWLEYIFGICQPDQRIGKRGSRSDLVMTVCENNLPRPVERGFIQ
jgi:hypothetical protein